ncbi:unnamed protein product [Miscanthus lutarioriparius]|uniref:SANT domain-containing protein n=1 Tax=Miscanthus lutarioriparius TaxID=422564 RepID=A0A811MYJ3_9POAL|nr:unnamed protein product [Miscanthus lutarioriparius]
MGSENVSLKIKKIRIVGYEDKQKHEDAHSSSKKRKTTDLGPTWTEDELMWFYKAYHTHGEDWKKISAVVGHKTPDMVKALYSMHQTFLSLPKHQATATGFITLVTDHRNVLDLSPSHRANKQTHRASGKAKKCGEATQQKAHEAPHLRDSYHAGTISEFSPSFKNRYYGGKYCMKNELVRNSQSHPVGNRTPQIPVLAPTDRSATDDATSELKNAICSTKRNNDRVSNDCANFSINEFSLDGRSRIMESTKGVEYQTFLTKGTGDTDIFQNQQPLKRKGMDQIMDRGQTSKAGHETLMEVREGNKPVGLLKAEQMFDEYISSDDMLILNVFQSLVSAADKMSKVKINFPSGTLRSETTLSDTDRKDEGISLVDVSKHGKPVDECSAYKANKKKHTELLDAEVPAEE